jgi:tetratricopeptide (TPR) repeat protein
MAVVLFIFALITHRKHRFFTFGLLFFTINVFLLPMASMTGDSTFLNDRYTYVAYIGLFFVIAMGMQQLLKKYPSYRLPIAGFAVVLLITLCILTVRYIPAWKNSETLWSDVIEKYPRQVAVAHFNRGNYWYKNNQQDKALEDFNAAIEINPEYSNAYINRSTIYLERGETEKALQDYNRYMELFHPYDAKSNILNLQLSESLGHRGVIYLKLGQYEKALNDFNAAIELDKVNLENYYKRALTYMQLREYDKAIQDFNLCHQSDPANSDIINNRGVCYLRFGDFKSAIADFDKAILLNGANASYYTNRAIAYQKLGRLVEARQDMQTAKKKEALIDQ